MRKNNNNDNIKTIDTGDEKVLLTSASLIKSAMN